MTVLERAVRVFGVDTQLIIAIEEMAELQKEICKFQRGKGELKHIAEEVADVEIMMEQLKSMFGLHGLVADYKNEKIMKLDKCINNHIDKKEVY